MSTPDLFVEVATQGDAAWFEKNPDRRLRLRNAVPGEFRDLSDPPVGMTWRVIVVEAQPGVRARQPLALPLSAGNDAMAEAQLFTLFMQAAPKEARRMVAQLRKMKLPSITDSK
ncbi:hypothetical protein CA236_00225 [Sphingomonas sp. ABOLG]|uniref:hypothetical protein n=1 Tax=Sphingomonas sp. ABOLG TaxID=1985880 RepID=UPI000F7F8731|nr:hypothetical protein [Sphingomonas sp. ABOLG]RSV20379.1 hypothetical protein CA236_00225 [Sphingomonas sp. ABOLG]